MEEQRQRQEEEARRAAAASAAEAGMPTPSADGKYRGVLAYKPAWCSNREVAFDLFCYRIGGGLTEDVGVSA